MINIKMEYSQIIEKKDLLKPNEVLKKIVEKGVLFLENKKNLEVVLLDYKEYEAMIEKIEYLTDFIAVSNAKHENEYTLDQVNEMLGINLKV